MVTSSRSERLLVIAGPTASGKTSLSVNLAAQFDGEVISADSRLFYVGMDIGTAKPTAAERDRVPHHLIDIRAPDATVTGPGHQPQSSGTPRVLSVIARASYWPTRVTNSIN